MSVRSGWETTRQRRAAAVRYLVYGAMTALLAAFFHLQILKRSQYALRSEENRLRAIPVPAARGAVYDRDGRLLAENVPGYSVSLLPGPADTIRATLERMAPYLALDEREREALLRKYRERPGRSLVLRDDATFEQVSAVEERRPQFRRAVVEMRPRRRYPMDSVAAHVLGYVGEISDRELEQPRFAGYRRGATVGQSGLERQYEERLSGSPGVRYVEVNAYGSIVREFGDRLGVRPVPGQDVTVTLDMGLQAYADSIFPDTMRGGVVALDPSTGGVLILYSHPGFDPNAFVGGIDRDIWESLRSDPDEPLLNRVTGAAYSPGSTWKPVVSTIALHRGMVSLEDRMEVPCRGALRYGDRVFRCWREEGHGPLTLEGAIQQSCNVYFYQLGMAVGLDVLMEGVERRGFNRRTGIDLPHELPGSFPASREWYDRRYGRRGWTESVVLNLAIGQGENSQTLLRQAVYYSALATGRRPVVPHLLRSDSFEDRRASWTLGLSEPHRRDLLTALVSAVNEPRGTAYWHRLRRWTLAGKTGTTQNPHGDPHSWFVGFAPADDPRVVVAALVEFGHPDDETSLAVPLASAVARRFLESRGVPPEDRPGRPTDGEPGREASATEGAGG